MIKHAWTVVREKSITDMDTNNVSLDVLEQINIKSVHFPAEAKGIIFPIYVEIVSFWYRGLKEKPVKGTARLRWIAPNGKEIQAQELEIDLAASHRYRSRTRINGLPIPKDTFGVFYFLTEVRKGKEWLEVARVPLQISLVAPR